MFEFDETMEQAAKIKVIGIGGGGGNAINTMIDSGLEGVEFISANTDVQSLKANRAPVKIQLGSHMTKGLGAGADPSIGREAAMEEKERIAEALAGSDMVFITAGMGGGTGTGGAPIVAQVARNIGALTVGVVTKPFAFEGRRRMRVAEEGIEALKQEVDTLITIPNERLLTLTGDDLSILDAFKKADEVLLHAVQGISDLITTPGLVNVDFADVRTVMNNMGMALMGSGVASGERRAVEAARNAIASPLLEDLSIEGATGILINITGSRELTLKEVNEAASLVREAAHEDANIIFGTVIDDSMKDSVRVTVIATGFGEANVSAKPVVEHEDRVVSSYRHAKPGRVVAKDGSGRQERVVPASSRRVAEPVDLRKQVREMEIPYFDEDQFDIPTFLRKQVD